MTMQNEHFQHTSSYTYVFIPALKGGLRTSEYINHEESANEQTIVNRFCYNYTYYIASKSKTITYGNTNSTYYLQFNDKDLYIITKYV